MDEGLSLGSDSRLEQMFATGLGKPKATPTGAIVGRGTQRPMKLQKSKSGCDASHSDILTATHGVLMRPLRAFPVHVKVLV